MATKLTVKNRQARRKEKTQGLLLEAATHLLLEKGFDLMTVQDITDYADVGRGTFYVYFESKEEVIWSILESILDPINEYLMANPALKDSDRYEKWRFIFKHISINQDVLKALLGEKGHISLLRRIEAYITLIMERDLKAHHLVPKNNIPIEFISQYLAGALTRVIVHWLENPQKTSIDALATQFFTLARQQFEPDDKVN